MNSYTFNFRPFLIIFIFIIAFALILMLTLIENHLRSDLTNNSLNNYRNLISKGKAAWIALGDSHTANSLISSKVLDNLGYASDNLNSISKKGLYRTQRLKPKGVILQATPHTFSFYRILDNQEQKTKYLISSKQTTFEFLNPITRPYLVNYLKSIFRKKVDNLLNSKKKQKKSVKWHEKTIQEKKYESSLRAQLHTPTAGFKNHKELKKFRNIIQFYVNQKIDVCLVRYPVSSFYLNKIKTIKIFQEVDMELKKIAKNYNLTFLDLTTLFDDEFFSNTDHISPNGKEFVTKTVSRGCKIND